jgi:uncharacterized membrane protein
MSDWYYAAENEQKGPVNDAELKAQLASSKLPADTLVWTDGMDGWKPANEVAALKAPAPGEVAPAAAPVAGEPDSTKPVGIADIMGKPEALAVTAEDAETNRIMGVIAYLPLLFLVTLVSAKDSPFARYHANQGAAVTLLVLAIVILHAVVDSFFSVLPWFFYYLSVIIGLFFIAPLLLTIYGIINAAAGKCVPLPVIGGLKLIK